MCKVACASYEISESLSSAYEVITEGVTIRMNNAKNDGLALVGWSTPERGDDGLAISWTPQPVVAAQSGWFKIRFMNGPESYQGHGSPCVRNVAALTIRVVGRRRSLLSAWALRIPDEDGAFLRDSVSELDGSWGVGIV
jgi:hypothetical protein